MQAIKISKMSTIVYRNHETKCIPICSIGKEQSHINMFPYVETSMLSFYHQRDDQGILNKLLRMCGAILQPKSYIAKLAFLLTNNNKRIVCRPR